MHHDYLRVSEEQSLIDESDHGCFAIYYTHVSLHVRSFEVFILISIITLDASYALDWGKLGIISKNLM